MSATPDPTIRRLRDLLSAPRGQEIAIGLALSALDRADLTALGHDHLRSLIERELLPGLDSPDYSTIMRWVRAAGVLDGPEDPRAAWGVSTLCELAKLGGSDALDAFVREHRAEDMSALSVRRLRHEVARWRGGTRARPGMDETHRVLQRAIAACLEPGIRVKVDRALPGETGSEYSVALTGPTLGTELSAALEVSGRVVAAIAEAKAAWHRGSAGEPTGHAALSLDEVLALPAGQLSARWADADTVEVSKGGVTLARLPVRRSRMKRTGGSSIPPGI